jgi:hypothetical protein
VDGEGPVWIAIGVTASVALGALAEPYRAGIGLENVVLAYVAVVVACAAVGGRRAGVATALGAAASYTFFFTTPYRTLHVDSAEQLITVAALAGAGLLAALGGRWTRRLGARERGERQAMRLVGELAGIAAAGGDPDRAAADGLLDLLGARRVEVWRDGRLRAGAGPPDDAPVPGDRRVMRLPLRRDGRATGELVVVLGRAAGAATLDALPGIVHVLALAGPGPDPGLDPGSRGGG